MNALLKDAWIAALRSGKYTQGRTRLNDKQQTEFCCLGVLCKVAGIDNPEGRSFSYDIVRALTDTPRTGDPDLVNTLMQMNDQQGKSFGEIADYIEANVGFKLSPRHT